MRRLVALALAGGPGFADALARCWDDGDAVLPVDLRLPRPAVERLLAAMRPEVLVTKDGATALEGAVAVEHGDAVVVATSGTTGEPKGVVLTHAAVEASARAAGTYLRVDPARDRWLACLPLSHIGGLSVVMRAMVAGVGVEIQPSFRSENARAAALERGATLVSLVPTALARLGAEGAGWFRTIVLGGQAPPPDRPANCVATYGMTETGSGVVYDGHPLDGVEVRIGAGEVWLRGPMLLRAYRDGSDPKTPDGWLPTGDSGQLGPDGRLQVTGRLDDVVISGGENIWPVAVEAVIRRHPEVADVAVGGRWDAEWGERVVAYVVAEPGSDAGDPAVLLAEIRGLVKAELPAFAAPREIIVVDMLPRTSLGKVQRGSLALVEGPGALHR